MSEVERWLSRLGLSRYHKVFAGHQIEFETLRLLSENDLREMGIPIGPRRRIIESLESLRSGRESHSLAASFLGVPSETAERRQLTILFCDIVGSTEYADRLSPEDFRNLTQEYLARCSGIVRSHDGSVVSYVGDAVQALFGYPNASEDDAERAIATAFDIIASVNSISVEGRRSLKVRLGIASGLAIVSGVRDIPVGGPLVAFGPVPHLASRLQTLAEPQTILVDDATYKEAEGAFSFTDLGRHAVKGFNEPIQTWRADGPLSPESRFARRTSLSPLIGRSHEIQRVLGSWNQAAGERRVYGILISGEPGIGKSRLVHEVNQQISGCAHITLQCYPAYSHTALFPFLSFLQRYAGILADDSAATCRGKLEEALASASIPTDISLPIFAKLLSVEQDAEALVNLSPARQREITRNVLRDIFRNLSCQKPLMLSVEDAHWIDPTSREVIDLLLGGDTNFPMLLVITTRQSLRNGMENVARVSEIALNRLNREESLSLLKSLSTETDLSAADCMAVRDRAEGVPLYLEEFARATIEARRMNSERTRVDRQLTAGVPSSLQSSLVARLDNLGPAKEVAQIASVIGRVFDVQLLRHLCRVADSVLDGLLDRLVEARLIAPQLSADGASYAFSHAILQEAARGTLTREHRQKLHERVAQALEIVHPKLSALRPEILAQHYAEAGRYEPAADRWFDAGIAASGTWAKTEAARMLALALECLGKLPTSIERKRKEVQFELERGDVLYAAYGYVTHESSEAYRRAMKLSEELGEPEAPIRALDGLFGTHFNSAQFNQAEGAGDRLIDIGRNGNNLKALVLGLEFKGMSRFCQGDYTGAQTLLEQALQHEDMAEMVGSDFPSMALLYLSWTLHILGYREKAVRTFDRAESIVRRQSAYRLAACLGDGCILFVMRNEGARVRALVDELIPLARENGFNLWLNMGLFFDGLVKATLDGDGSGLRSMQEVCDALGDQEIDKTCYLGVLADAYVNTGNLAEAAKTIDRALEQVATTGERYFEAELIRLRGMVELNWKHDPRTAEKSFRQALALAHDRKARGWELRAAQNLADLLRSENKPEAARRELDPLIEWFSRFDEPLVTR